MANITNGINKDDELFKREVEEIKRIRRGKEGKDVGRLIEYLTQGSHEKGLEKGMEKGLETGLRLNAFQNAEKMQNLNAEWKFITEVTGVTQKALARWIKNGRK